MMRTYRLVAEAVEGQPLTSRICVDVVIRVNGSRRPSDLDLVADQIHKFLNVGPFAGSFVDSGTDRTEAITLA